MFKFVSTAIANGTTVQLKKMLILNLEEDGVWEVQVGKN